MQDKEIEYYYNLKVVELYRTKNAVNIHRIKNNFWILILLNILTNYVFCCITFNFIRVAIPICHFTTNCIRGYQWFNTFSVIKKLLTKI